MQSKKDPFFKRKSFFKPLRRDRKAKISVLSYVWRHCNGGYSQKFNIYRISLPNQYFGYLLQKCNQWWNQCNQCLELVFKMMFEHLMRISKLVTKQHEIFQDFLLPTIWKNSICKKASVAIDEKRKNSFYQLIHMRDSYILKKIVASYALFSFDMFNQHLRLTNLKKNW